MTARAQAVELLNFIPEADIPVLLEVIKRFALATDDIATPDDIAAHDAAIEEYQAGQTIPHDAIDWD